MQLIVLGMHRSGTSSITRLLNLAGAYFGPEGIATDPNEENPKGFWERRDVRAVCDGLLHAGGYDWWRIADFDLDRIPGPARHEHVERFRRIVLELDAHRPWVMKEPRLCLLWPLLRPELEAPVVVHVLRDPLEVADSLRRRNGFPAAVGLGLWEAYTCGSLAASRDDPSVTVSYADLLEDPVGTTTALVAALEELGVQGLRTPTEREIGAFVTPHLHHQRRRPEERRAFLTGAQLDLAAAIDDRAPPRTTDVTPGTWETLRAFEAAEARIASLQDGLATAQERIGSLEAAERDAAADRVAFEAAVADLRADLAHLEELLARRTTTRELAERGLGRLRRSRVLRFGWRVASGPVRQARTASQIEVAVKRTLVHLRATRRELDADGPSRPVEPDRTAADPPPADVLRARRRDARSGGARTKVAVLVWDVGHNPFGRAHLLADLLSDRFDVELWGAQFERYGTAVWAPMRSTRLPVVSFPGTEFPGFLATLERVARHIDADALYVSKSRLPALALGAMAKENWNRHLVVDVDDFEPSFFDEATGIEPGELLRGDHPDLALPFGRGWTRASEAAVTGADAITVSNVELQARYGGIIVPHARNEATFDPARFDRTEVRRRLGLGEGDRLILFGGTPRKHKGIVELLDAVEELGDDRVRIGAFASRDLDEVTRAAGASARWILPMPSPSFDELPSVLAAADLTCALQAPGHPVSRFQMPAKVTDALAMEVPCLVTPVPPLQPLIDEGVLEVHDGSEPLAEHLRRLLADPHDARDRARRGRQVFLEAYSYGAVRPAVVGVIEGGVDDPAPPSPRLGALLSTVRRRFGADSSDLPPVPRRPVPPGSNYDLVVFWKQNDTGIYGRRQDMFVKYLEASGRFETIVHFDHPMSVEALVRNGRRSLRSNDQTRFVVRGTLRRVTGRADRGRVRQRTFLYGERARTRRAGLPPRSGFVEYVRSVLVRQGVGGRPVVFWTYPTNEFLPALIDGLAPDLVVTDVVDDNRSWHEPGTPPWEDADRNYREVLARSDVVIANCDAVARGMRDLTPEVHVIPNACELPSGDGRGPRPAELRGLSRPIVGYAGNLSGRIDVGLLRQVIRAHREWDFVLVGSTHLDRSVLDVTGEPNVRFVGAKPYERTKALISHFDVAIIPHLDNGMSRSMNPLKAYVYAAARVPIVATPVANLEELAGFITVADGPEAFAVAIRDAIAGGRPSTPRARLEPHSWEVRVRDALRLVDSGLDRARAEGGDGAVQASPGADRFAHGNGASGGSTPNKSHSGRQPGETETSISAKPSLPSK